MAELVPEAELGLPSGFRGYRVGREGAPPRRAAALNRRPASVTLDPTLFYSAALVVDPGAVTLYPLRLVAGYVERQQYHEPVYCMVHGMSPSVRH